MAEGGKGKVMEGQRLCKDCRWCDSDKSSYRYWTCAAPKNLEKTSVCPLTGEVLKVWSCEYCDRSRGIPEVSFCPGPCTPFWLVPPPDLYCGKEGRWWEPKPVEPPAPVVMVACSGGCRRSLWRRIFG